MKNNETNGGHSAVLSTDGLGADVPIREICELALKGEFSFPPLPPGIVKHQVLGELCDRLQMQQYGLRVAEAMLKAAITGTTIFEAPNAKVRGPEAALSPEAPSRLPGSTPGDNEERTGNA